MQVPQRAKGPPNASFPVYQNENTCVKNSLIRQFSKSKGEAASLVVKKRPLANRSCQ
jgi:hypothetical protein